MQFLRVGDQFDRTQAGAYDRNLGYAFDTLQFFFDNVFNNLTGLLTAARIGRKSKCRYRLRRNIETLHDRLVNAVRQTPAHRRYFFTHFAGHFPWIDAQLKFQYRLRITFANRRRQSLDTGNLTDAVLDRPGDQGFHFFRRSAGIGNADAYQGQFNVRIQIDTQIRIRLDAEYYQQQYEHRRKNRSAYKCAYHFI